MPRHTSGTMMLGARTAAAALALLWAGGAVAQPVPGLGQKVPFVLILLDTSGSMEYAEDENVVPVCTDAYDPLMPYAKSRWAVALEVFTGTLNQYWCSYDWRVSPTDREDYGYPIPHAVPRAHGMPAQAPNGFLDVNEDYAAFAFMAFDNNLGTSQGVEGGFSYGLDVHNVLAQLVNMGARNEYANELASGGFTQGGVIGVASKDVPGIIRSNNRKVQETMLGTVPFGGSPVSPLLTDAQYYLLTDPRLQQYSSNTGLGDPFYGCRTRSVILFTDGRPTMGEGDGDYLTSPEAAADLYATHPLGVRTYVVAYSLASDLVKEALDAIAVAGDPENPNAKAFEAQNQAQLVLKLSEILGEITAGVKSRTVPVYTNATRSTDAQYQVNSAYGNVPVNSIDQQGYLEQAIFECIDECRTASDGAGLCRTFSISDAFNAAEEAPPTYAIVGDGTTLFAKTNDDLTPELLGVPDKGLSNVADAPQDFLSLTPQYVPPGNPKQTLGTQVLHSNVQAHREQFRDELVDFVLAAPGSRREGYRMGAMGHGTPAVQHDQRNQSSLIPSFRYFQERIKDRPTVLFVPSHIGALTAFRIDRDPDLDAQDYGQALWSFIPNALLPRLQENAAQVRFLMDLAPVVKDILPFAEKLAANPESEGDRWISLLIQGYREGGRGYFALDVTDPTQPKYLWEISHERRCEAEAGCVASSATDRSNDFCYLGNTFSRPALGTVYLEGYNGVAKQDRAVAVFGGGRFEEETDQVVPDGCGGHDDFLPKAVGASLYVVDAASGLIIRDFRANRNGDPGLTAQDRARMVYDMVGSPACFSTTNSAVTTRCFIGDRGGQLWRLDLTSPDPSKWTLSFFHDAYAALGYAPGSPLRGPIEDPPTLVLQRTTGLLTVIYATTNIDLTETVDALHAIYSLSEKVDYDPDTGEEIGVSAEENWKLLFDEEVAEGQVLAQGTMVVGQPVAFDEVVYFTTFRFDPEAACGVEDEEAARLWGVHYYRPDPNDTLGTGTPLPQLDKDGTFLTPDDLVHSIPLGTVVPYGVQLIQRPSCVGEVPLDYLTQQGGDATGGASTGTVGVGDMELVVQVAGAGDIVGPKAPKDSEAAKIQTFRRTIRPPRSTVLPISWGTVYD